MNKLWKTVGTVVPGPALLFAGKWIELFSATQLSYPGWAAAADRLALGISTAVAVLLSVALKDTSKPVLKGLLWAGFLLFIVGILACSIFWFRLGSPMSPADVSRLQTFWEAAYVATLVDLVATITVAALSLREDKPKWFWALVVATVLLAVAIGLGLYFFHR